MSEDLPTYNGWTNYETWLVNLWLTNDEHTYDLCRSMARNCLAEVAADEILSKKERASQLLSDGLKDLIEDQNPLSGEASVYTDLLNAAIGEVDWRAIALAFFEDSA